ncbi:MAG: DAK2 domain-containing protein [Actinobacteria bacterium]|nr:DAK2 domain-containing protein [Actinomycetota bacterium]
MALSLLRLNDVREFLNLSYELIKLSEQEINNLNVFPVPDGDTGTNMLLTMSSVAAAVESDSVTTLVQLADVATKSALLGARGNSGVILSQIIKGFFSPVKEDNLQQIDPKSLIKCLESARQTAYRAVKKPVEGTMLTVIRYAAESVSKMKKSRRISLSDVIEEAFRNAVIALQKTPEMLDVLREAGVIDAGGLGLVKILEALKSIILEEKSVELSRKEEVGSSVEFARIPSEKINYTFCTEFLILSKTLDVDSTNEFLNSHGDSVLVIRDDEIVKIHVHTDKPIELLNHFKNFGEFLDIKVNNMRVQTEEANKIRKERKNEVSPEKPIAIVSVAQGDGIIEIFKSLGVDRIVEGGQTMNPSSEQILSAIEDAPSNNVIVLPNNKNVILACEQAAVLSEKNVTILPTKSIQQGLQAMLAFNPVLSVEENYRNMMDSLNDVVSVALTKAVKDSNINGLKIQKGDYLGLVDGKIVENGMDLTLVLVKTLKKAGIEDASFVTVLLGKDLESKDKELIPSIIEKNFPDVEFDVKHGGQDHYPILAAIER